MKRVIFIAVFFLALAFAAEAQDLRLYPNPVQRTLTVAPEGDITQLKVLNVIGKEMQVNAYRSNFDTWKVDMNDLPAGIYIIVVTNQAGEERYGRLRKLAR